MERMEVKENPYTRNSLEDLAQTHSKLNAALRKRRDAYEAELARQKANDELCKEFAEMIKSFSGWISNTKDAITRSKDSLEGQLANVEARIASVAEDGKPLEAIAGFDKKLEAAGITSNKHTTLTYKDVKVQWEQYQVLLQKKKATLEEEIENQKLAGITADQMAEINENFKTFAKNGSLGTNELKALLYSLGEELSNAEVARILQENESAPGAGIQLDAFTSYMVKKWGDTDTKEEVLESFKLLNRGKDVANLAEMEIVLKEQHSKYLRETMVSEVKGESETGLDYNAWTDAVYAR